MQFTMRIADFPIAGQQLDGGRAFILNPNVIGPKPTLLRWSRLFRQKIGTDPDDDAMGLRHKREE
jgi:hypothetical protein